MQQLTRFENISAALNVHTLKQAIKYAVLYVMFKLLCLGTFTSATRRPLTSPGVSDIYSVWRKRLRGDLRKAILWATSRLSDGVWQERAVSYSLRWCETLLSLMRLLGTWLYTNRVVPQLKETRKRGNNYTRYWTWGWVTEVKGVNKTPCILWKMYT